jgi:hypothetical protein
MRACRASIAVRSGVLNNHLTMFKLAGRVMEMTHCAGASVGPSPTYDNAIQNLSFSSVIHSPQP